MTSPATPKPDRTFEAGLVVLLLGAAGQLLLSGPLTGPDDSMGALFSGCCGGPFYLVGFILGIVALSRGRIRDGVSLLLLSLAAPLVVGGFKLAFTT